MRDRFIMLGCAENEYPLKSIAFSAFFKLGFALQAFEDGLSFVRDG